MTVPACPICEKLFATSEALAEHLVADHASETWQPHDGFTFRLHLDKAPLSFRCICGLRFRFAWERDGLTLRLRIPQRLLHHIDLKGGWAAHILQTKMAPKRRR